MSDERQPIERVLDLALYAPLGVALVLRDHLRDEFPKQVRQGRQAAENRVQLARFIGQLAVQAGQRELSKRIEAQRAANLARDLGPDGDPDASPEVDPGETAAAVRERDPIGDGGDGDDGDDGGDMQPTPDEVPTADELPISDYESLAAIHVVERLRSMQPDEIELIRRFEVAHRSRRTILAKVDQLQGR